MQDHKIHADAPRLLRVSETARYLYGDVNPATRARVVRLVDGGQLRAIRVGTRGDRWIPLEAVIDLLAGDASGER